jgi:phosphoenolpyruvate synthase/pyruvate phosphate dikinase
MKKKYFELTFTRERQIITQIAWQYANHKGIEKLLHIKVPFSVGIVVYVNNGLVEDWDNKEAVKFLKNKVLKTNKEDPDFLLLIINKFNRKTKKYFNLLWDNTSNDIAEIKTFVEQYYKYSSLFAFIWISMLDKRTPLKYMKALESWRKTDDFFGKGSEFLGRSLQAIYPELKSLVNYITKEELDNPPSENILKKRQKNFICVQGKKYETLPLEKFAQKNKDLIFIYPKVLNRKMIKGQIASAGKATGKVKILRLKKEMGKVKKGDILVSPMSVPEFLPAMKNASAFVTDEGGIMCHAAIVAREMHKPCVIGTKIATKVLKDGDLVEVDADKEIVKIIK